MLAITGSTGFIGSYLIDALPTPHKRFLREKIPPSSSFEQFIGDLNHPSDVEAFVKNTDTLIHLAWVNNPWNSNDNVMKDISHNLLSTISLFEAFAKKNPQGHIIFASSGGNMYKKNSDSPHYESDLPCPWTSYSINKLAAENYLHLFSERYGIRATILRISNPYGVLLPSNRTNGLIGVIFSKLMHDETLNVIDSLESVRDYIHLDDLTKAMDLVIKTPPPIGKTRIFNVSSGRGTSLKRVLETMEEVTGKKIKTNFLNHNCEPSYSVLSSQHFYNTLGWSSQIGLKEGLIKMWGQISSQRHTVV